MNDMVRIEHKLPMSAAEVRQHVNLVQEVMKAVMKKDTHYGTIPGTPKPTLYKPGAEVLAATFRIATSYHVEDLSGDGFVRYRVTCTGTHQGTGLTLGAGMGECSSLEEKYKWRKASTRTEFDKTPEHLRRFKYGYNRQERKDYEIQQVRTEPADLANTILKMACKRAQVAMTLNVTAASDIFTQDIEDLPEELRQQDEGHVERDTGPKPYPDDQFTKNLPAWTQLIVSGKKTADAIIATVSSKAILSEDQQKKIRAIKKPDSAPPTVDVEQLAKRMREANDIELLAADADLISAVQDAEKRGELADIYNKRMEELSA